jgi:hypothetical protein
VCELGIAVGEENDSQGGTQKQQAERLQWIQKFQDASDWFFAFRQLTSKSNAFILAECKFSEADARGVELIR